MRKSLYLSSLLAICFSFCSVAVKAQAPVVTTDPSNATACNGTNTIFGIIATGATSYIWQVSTDGIAWDTVHNGGAYTTATDDTVHIHANTSLDAHMYRCIAINASGKDTSMPATLTVTDVPPTVSFLTPTAICVGSTVNVTPSILGGVWTNVNHAIDTVDPNGMVEGRMFGTDTLKYTLTNSCGSTTTRLLMQVDTVMVAAPITGPTGVCVGNHIFLSNTNVIGDHIWSVNDPAFASISSSGIVTGLAGGTTTITYDIENACGAVQSTLFIHIDTILDHGSISGASSLCRGTWVHLTETVGGGIWLSGNTSVANVDGSGNVTGIGQGTSIISYYMANSCGASYATHTITVSVPVGPIGGNDSVGIDSSLTLTNIATGGTWTSLDPSIASVGSSSGIVTGHDTGITTIIYTVTNECGTSTIGIVMNVGPLPSAGTISGPDSVCKTATITLTGLPGTWYSKYDTVATVDPLTGVVTGVGYGIDSIFHIVTTAFGSKKVGKRIFVNQSPQIVITGPATVALGGAYGLSATPTGGTWTAANDTMSSLIGYGFFVVTGFGGNRFTYSVTNTCGSASKFFDISLPDPNGVRSVTASTGSMNIFPNPTEGAITLTLATSVNEQAHVIVADMLGRTVKELGISTNVATSIALDQPAGIYMITAITESGIRYTAKINIAK